MKKVETKIIVILAIVFIFFGSLILSIIFEDDTSKHERELKTIAESIAETKKVADLDAHFTALADLRGKISDSTLVVKADKLLASQEEHTKRLILAEKKDAAGYAFELAKAAILKGLKSPKAASFSGYSESNYWYDQEEDLYYVQLYVDAQNSFGAMIRQYYQVKLQINDANWKMVDLMEIDGY
jgi:hypothetical protein